jgi:hypothetical protein
VRAVRNGCRAILGSSQIPALAEPLFLGLGATIQVHPVMTPEDLGKAAPAIEQAAKKYG